MVATSFLAMCPLLPIPQITNCPLSPRCLVIASTAALKPLRATGSVSYRRVRHERAVASVPRTCTAFDNRSLKLELHGSESSGGVIDIRSSKGGESSLSHGVAGEGGDGGGTEGA